MRSRMAPLHNLNYITLQWSKPTSIPIAKKIKNGSIQNIFESADILSEEEEFLARFPADWWIPSHKESPPACYALRTRYYFTFPYSFFWDSLDAWIPPVLYGQLQTIVPTGLRCSEQHTQAAGICGQDQCLQRQRRSSFSTKQSRPGRAFLAISEGPQNKGFPLLPSTRPAHRSDGTVECRPAEPQSETIFYD